MQIEDNRTEEEKGSTLYFVVATDSALSGWGLTSGKSFYALAITKETRNIDDRVFNNLNARPEMKRVRTVLKDKRGLPGIKGGANDHLSIVGPTCARSYYK